MNIGSNADVSPEKRGGDFWETIVEEIRSLDPVFRRARTLTFLDDILETEKDPLLFLGIADSNGKIMEDAIPFFERTIAFNKREK